MAHATLTKFGYPASLVHEGANWCVMLRKAQVTLGALVLACKEEATSFSGISAAAFSELPAMIHGIETTLKAFRPYDRINYLMLMMVDPHVHFHVIPRYGRAQDFEGQSFADAGWPGPPNLQVAVELDGKQGERIRSAIAAVWPKGSQ
jgi:diadenosine tetraphosphate (Ap4A) HIT family hydrolase